MAGVDELEEQHRAVLADREVADLVGHEQRGGGLSARCPRPLPPRKLHYPVGRFPPPGPLARGDPAEIDAVLASSADRPIVEVSTLDHW